MHSHYLASLVVFLIIALIVLLFASVIFIFIQSLNLFRSKSQKVKMVIALLVAIAGTTAFYLYRSHHF